MTAPGWLDELPLRPGPPWHVMGTRGFDPAAWPGDDRDPALADRKLALLRSAHGVVSARRPSPEVDAAEAEVAALVGAAPGDDLTPLEAAALAVPDDLCLLVRRDGAWRLDSGVVCFPSMWRLADKLGQPMAGVHGPVPAYAEELAARVDRLLDRLPPERPVWRRNWFVHATDELHLPDPPPPPVVPPAVPAGLWLRSERQTLRRLPSSGAVLFTIRTQQAPLVAVAERPDVASAMAAVVRAWPDELVAYRGAGPWRDGLVAWLEAAGATA